MNVITKDIYTAEVTVSGGRSGRARSSDGLLDLALARPGAGQDTNPEQLMAAGWAACFQSALNGIAKREGVDAAQSSVTARVTLGNEADGGYALKAALTVSIPGVERAKAEDLAQKAHAMCPYSKAMRGNIEAEVTVAQA